MASTSPSSPTSPSGKKLVNTKSGLRMISLIDEERSAFEIDEPVWQNDNDVSSEYFINFRQMVVCGR